MHSLDRLFVYLYSDPGFIPEAEDYLLEALTHGEIVPTLGVT